MKNCAFCWFLLHINITMNGSKNVKFQNKFYENVVFEEQSNSVTADEVRARRH
jgi:hypothetical protein